MSQSGNLHPPQAKVRPMQLVDGFPSRFPRGQDRIFTMTSCLRLLRIEADDTRSHRWIGILVEFSKTWSVHSRTSLRSSFDLDDFHPTSEHHPSTLRIQRGRIQTTNSSRTSWSITSSKKEGSRDWDTAVSRMGCGVICSVAGRAGGRRCGRVCGVTRCHSIHDPRYAVRIGIT
jgi:hypothetical protein